MYKLSGGELLSILSDFKKRGNASEPIISLPSIGRTEEVCSTNSIMKFVKGILVVVGALAVIAGVAYLVYRFLTPDYEDEFDDDFDDTFDDDGEDLFEEFDDEPLD